MQRRRTKLFTNPVMDTVAISTKDKATRRVIAPYVKLPRKPEMVPFPKEIENQKTKTQKTSSVLLHDRTSYFSDTVDLVLLLQDTADELKIATKATRVTLYMVDSASEEIYLSQKNLQGEAQKVSWKIQKGSIVAAYVAFQKEYLMVDDILGDERFPAGVGCHSNLVKSVLCVPIITQDGHCYAVIELYRDIIQPPFAKEDLKISIIVTGWIGAAIHQNHQRLALQKQQELNDHLLDLTKCYFAETIKIEKMITEFVKFSKVILGAERGSFFIIEEDTEDMIAEVFQESIDADDNITMQRKNIKVPLAKDRSIAGLVARTGATVNIKDTSTDPRYYTEVQEKTGFTTKSILCMPILSVDNILGVLQVCNKINDVCFTPADENLFKTFSVYCALALHFTRLQQRMFKIDKINKCILTLLKRQLRPCIHDMTSFTSQPCISPPYNFNEFRWYINPEEYDETPRLVVLMMQEIVGLSCVSITDLMGFILTVKKSYRNNYYHNWEHAFNFAHCMYNILRRNKKIFTDIELKTLLLAALCHDLDHGGFTNNFLQLTDDTLAQLYDESPLEHHHYRVGMTILSEFLVYPDISKETFEKISKQMKEAILATDLAAYFKYRVKLLQLFNDGNLDWDNDKHRMLIKAIMMTSCDLSGNCKPFLIAKRVADNVYKEFYNQGDLEKKMGLTPLSLMDREKSQMVPEDQAQFLSVVVLPCVDLLQMVLPNTQELYNEAMHLRETWQEIIRLKEQKSWTQDDPEIETGELNK